MADGLAEIPGYDPAATAGDCVFDADAARLAIDFFGECVTHVKGERAGQPFELEPWQVAIVANLFGWKRPDGTRRYREAFIYVARKNGKTTLAAGVCLLMLFCDGEPGAEVYSAAAERDQAALVFDAAKHMVWNEPILNNACRVFRTSIAIESIGSVYRPISAEASTKHGYNVHCVVIDELHAQKDRELVDVLMTATGARRQPLVIHITTADFDRPSICNEKYEYATRVRDGVIDDPSFLPVIFEAPEGADWKSPATWRHANPNLGVSISEEYLARECQRAQDEPTYENTFKRLHLNIRTQQDVRWLSLERWDRGAGEITDAELAGVSCWGGLDIGSTRDLTSLCLLFPDIADDGSLASDVVRARWWFWCPEERAREREKRDRVPYVTWARDGFVRMTPGDETDYAMVQADVLEILGGHHCVDLAVDRLFQGQQLCQNLSHEGVNVIPFGQGFYSMAAPSQEFERRVNRGDFRHGDNPVARWMASNVAVEMDAAGNVKPSKKKSTERIDGIVTAVMALGRLMERDRQRGSVYDERGITFL